MPTSREKHLDRVRKETRTTLLTHFHPEDVNLILALLSDIPGHYCALCGYRQKAPTGTNTPTEIQPLDDIEEIIRNRQRDGDAGDLSIRQSHAVQILEAFRKWRMTDQELAKRTGIYL